MRERLGSSLAGVILVRTVNSEQPVRVRFVASIVVPVCVQRQIFGVFTCAGFQ